MLNDTSLFSPLRSSRALILAAAASLLVAGIGAVTSYVGTSHEGRRRKEHDLILAV